MHEGDKFPVAVTPLFFTREPASPPLTRLAKRLHGNMTGAGFFSGMCRALHPAFNDSICTLFRLPMRSSALTLSQNCLLLLIIAAAALLPHKAAASGSFNYKDVVPVEKNTYFAIYDFILPSMIGALTISPSASPSQKVWQAISYVNFHATPKVFTRYPGLGTNAHWRVGASLMLLGGNMLCSEQSMLAALLLEPYAQKIAYRDVNNHTFHEVLIGKRWFLIDPWADNRLRNAAGDAVAFKDIEDYLLGDTSALRLPAKPLPRTLDYLELFKKSNYHGTRHAYGEHVEIKSIPYSTGVGIPVDIALRTLRSNDLLHSDRGSIAYLSYIRNNIYHEIITADHPRRKASEIQDWFLSRLSLPFSGTNARGPDLKPFFMARQRQLLGRLDQALAEYRGMRLSPEIAFRISQILFLQRNIAEFNSLRKHLSENIFYRYLYYNLNGLPLSDSDLDTFSNFKYRHLEYNQGKHDAFQ